MRAFVAIRPPATSVDQITELVDRLQRELPSEGVKFARKDQLHVTLRFLGVLLVHEVEAVMDGLEQACRLHSPFTLQGAKLGLFPQKGNPRVLWLGLEGDVERLLALQGAVSEHLRGYGSHEEDPGFTPHITLARFQRLGKKGADAVRELTAKEVELKLQPWPVETIELVESRLAARGPTYSDVLSCRLDGKP